MANSKKGLLRGSKISSKHQTVIDAAGPMIEIIKEFKEVTKIVIGEIKPIGSGAMRIKFQPIPAGFKVIIRGSTAVQTLYVYTSNPALTEKNAMEQWRILRS